MDSMLNVSYFTLYFSGSENFSLGSADVTKIVREFIRFLRGISVFVNFQEIWVLRKFVSRIFLDLKMVSLN